MSERELQAAVLDGARLNGWMAYHTFDSRRSASGFPDLILVRGRRLLAVELKSARGRVTEDQRAWLRAFAGVHRVEAFVVREDPERGPADSMEELGRLLAGSR